MSATGGVSAPRVVSAQGGVVSAPGGSAPQGVSALGLLLGGGMFSGGVCQHALRQTPPC